MLSEVYKFNHRFKENAIVQECASNQRILSNNVLTTSTEFAIKLPSDSDVKRRICQINQQQRRSGLILKSDNFEIPQKNLTTKKDDDFLFEDGNIQQWEKSFWSWEHNSTCNCSVTTNKVLLMELSKAVRQLLSDLYIALPRQWNFSDMQLCIVAGQKNRTHMWHFGKNLNNSLPKCANYRCQNSKLWILFLSQCGMCIIERLSTYRESKMW